MNLIISEAKLYESDSIRNISEMLSNKSMCMHYTCIVHIFFFCFLLKIFYRCSSDTSHSLSLTCTNNRNFLEFYQLFIHTHGFCLIEIRQENPIKSMMSSTHFTSTHFFFFFFFQFSTNKHT